MVDGRYVQDGQRPMTSQHKDGTNSDPLTRVVSGGFCIGCGACAAIPNGGLSMRLDSYGCYVPSRVSESVDGTFESFDAICPFSGNSADEDELATKLFQSEGGKLDDGVGRYVATYVGHAASPEERATGSSGGLATWLLCRSLQDGVVDAVVHVAPSGGEGLFSYTVSRSPEAVRAGSKSRYYPVELSGVLDIIRRVPGRYAIVGIPCFIKAINLLRSCEPALAERIVLTVGIFCGHLKSAQFTEYLVECLGHDVREAKTVDFRKKLELRSASDYGFEAVMQDGTTATRPMSEIYGGNWGYGFFKYEACNYCDDVAAETADVAFGDAWLPEYITDSGGTNVVVVRTKAIDAIFRAGMSEGQIELEPITVARVVESQAAGLRDRREGLGYRLELKATEGEWAPRKRVPPSSSIPKTRKLVYDLRMEIARMSHDAFNSKAVDAIAIFKSRMVPLTARYDRFYRPSVQQWLFSIRPRLARKLREFFMLGHQ